MRILKLIFKINKLRSFLQNKNSTLGKGCRFVEFSAYCGILKKRKRDLENNMK